jgi:hypothetical protein
VSSCKDIRIRFIVVGFGINRRWRGLRRIRRNCRSGSGTGIPGGGDNEQSELISNVIMILSIRFQ